MGAYARTTLLPFERQKGVSGTLTPPPQAGEGAGGRVPQSAVVYSALAGVRFGSLLSSQPPPSATIRLTTAESCEKRVASRFCWSLSSVASAVTTVVKFCVPA